MAQARLEVVVFGAIQYASGQEELGPTDSVQPQPPLAAHHVWHAFCASVTSYVPSATQSCHVCPRPSLCVTSVHVEPPVPVAPPVLVVPPVPGAPPVELDEPPVASAPPVLVVPPVGATPPVAWLPPVS